MSLINKMLQDLDRRNAMAEPDGSPPPRQVRAVNRALNPFRGGEWFWRVMAVLMVAALAWVGWVAYQLLPRDQLATPEAFAAGERARTRIEVAAQQVKPPEPKVVVVEKPNPEPQVPRESFRLAQAIETPITERAAKAAPKPAEKPAVKTVLKAEKPRIERKDRTVTTAERAEAEFRAAVEMLRQGRAGQAEEGFHAALQLDPAHRAARQALVALQLERGQLEAARRMLQEGLKIDPAQPDFSVALARILVERKDFPGALTALQASAGAAGGHAEHHFLHGTVLQRLNRHREAADAYRDALKVQEASPRSWIGLGISLEALQQRPEAAEAFKRALASGPADGELKSFAEQRLRALR